MGKKTRKITAKADEKSMTIPQLRKAFEHIDSFLHKKLKDGIDDAVVKSFRKEWKKTFGKDVSEASAKEYLNFVAHDIKSQKGGGQNITPAPLSYEMQAGRDIPYVSVPSYINSGFGFGNKDSLLTTCGQPNNLPTTTPAGLGSNTFQKGGRRATRRNRKQKGGASMPSFGTAIAEAFQRPLGMGAPPSMLQDAQMLAKGTNALASPRPEIPTTSFPTTAKITGAEAQF